MKTAIAILAGLLAGVLVAAGVLAAFVFIVPDPVAVVPTPSPLVFPTASIAPSASAGASGSPVPTGSAPSPSGSGAVQTGLHVGEPAPSQSALQLAGGTIDVARSADSP
ncbi:MAG TPA: hypothetical protein VHS36_02010 [Candidatus Limnocylindrales bacterium]|nr:hypothetical protein [Candidatus Limnocylindrales bacterium]